MPDVGLGIISISTTSFRPNLFWQVPVFAFEVRPVCPIRGISGNEKAKESESNDSMQGEIAGPSKRLQKLELGIRMFLKPASKRIQSKLTDRAK